MPSHFNIHKQDNQDNKVTTLAIEDNFEETITVELIKDKEIISSPKMKAEEFINDES